MGDLVHASPASTNTTGMLVLQLVMAEIGAPSHPFSLFTNDLQEVVNNGQHIIFYVEGGAEFRLEWKIMYHVKESCPVASTAVHLPVV
nr:hypothetical protein CFP56_05729 [Quercus suber]